MNKMFLVFLLCCFASTFLGQTDVQMPRKESRPYFQIEKFPMGLDKDSLSLLYERQKDKPKMRWSQSDSITFLMALIAAEEYDDAEQFFQKNRNLKPRSLDELHLLQYLYNYKRRYKSFKKWLRFEQENYGDSLSAIPIRQRIHDVEEGLLAGQWTKDSVIFPELKNLSKRRYAKGSKAFLTETIPLVKKIDQALRVETKYEFESNITLAIAFMEFGVFLERNVSTTDAFIALSVARYYDKFNAEINDEYRRLRTLLNERKLIFPSFRELFPKQSKGYFNIESILARKKAREMEEIQEKQNPEMLKLEEVESRAKIEKPWGVIILLSAMVLMLLLFAILLKTKK